MHKDLKDNRMVDYRKIITIEAGKRGGKPCIRGMRITVYDILNWLASGMSTEKIVEEYPELQAEDIFAALSFAADRERRIPTLTTCIF
ncbi:MAG: DUF433 domain-containing protein [Bacteroidales bacterium]|jgi:uncharacterized protein (DUF433 family)